MVVGRAPHSAPRVPTLSAHCHPEFLLSPSQAETCERRTGWRRGSARSGAQEWAPGRRESSGRGGARKTRGRRGLAPLRRAHQVALGQVARARRCRHSSAGKPVPGPGLRPLPFALPTPLGPSPSLAKRGLAIKPSREPKSPTGQLPQLDHSRPAGSALGWGEGRRRADRLRAGDVSVVEDRGGAKSQAFPEPATDWRERGAGAGRTR